MLVHVGFAMSRIDEAEAAATLQVLNDLGEVQQELAADGGIRMSGTLKSLYPFLHGRKQDPAQMNAALLAAVAEKIDHHRGTIDAFFAKNSQAVIDASGAIAETYRRRGRMFTMGNGGSSCDAAHVAVEFMHPVTAGRPALTAIDLTADRTMMTAGRATMSASLTSMCARSSRKAAPATCSSAFPPAAIRRIW